MKRKALGGSDDDNTHDEATRPEEEAEAGYEHECSDDDIVRPLSSIRAPLCMFCVDRDDDDMPQDRLTIERSCCPVSLELNNGDFEGYVGASDDEDSDDEDGSKVLSSGVQDNVSEISSAVFVKPSTASMRDVISQMGIVEQTSKSSSGTPGTSPIADRPKEKDPWICESDPWKVVAGKNAGRSEG